MKGEALSIQRGFANTKSWTGWHFALCLRILGTAEAKPRPAGGPQNAAWRGGTTLIYIQPCDQISSFLLSFFRGAYDSLPIPEADFKSTGVEDKLSVVATHNVKLRVGTE